MTWAPGRQVVTAQDHAEWQAWKRRRNLEAQQARRKKFPRIDYYPSPAALEIIEARLQVGDGQTYVSVIDALIESTANFRNKKR